jgi:hypothetical protein
MNADELERLNAENNALLIAAAWGLLQVVEQVADCDHSEYCEAEPPPEHCICLVGPARAALAKANVASITNPSFHSATPDGYLRWP